MTCATFARPEPRVELELLGEGWSLRFGKDLATLRLDEHDKTTILRCRNNPAVQQTTAFLEAGRGLISGVHDHTGLAFICALALILLFGVWTLAGLRNAETSA